MLIIKENDNTQKNFFDNLIIMMIKRIELRKKFKMKNKIIIHRVMIKSNLLKK